MYSELPQGQPAGLFLLLVLLHVSFTCILSTGYQRFGAYPVNVSLPGESGSHTASSHGKSSQKVEEQS